MCIVVRTVSVSRGFGTERETHLLDGAKDGEAEVVLTGLLGADAANELGAVLERLLAVEGGLSH